MNPEIVAQMAAEWECPISQMEAFASIIKQRGGLTGSDKDDLNLAAIAYAKACSTHECIFWLPFKYMPGWEDDVFCILEDEEAWDRAVNHGHDIGNLAKSLRASVLSVLRGEQ